MTFENLIYRLGHVARINDSNSLTSVLFQSRGGEGGLAESTIVMWESQK